jgi:3-oxoacyl-[acyl-carrier-protein] synthase III
MAKHQETNLSAANSPIPLDEIVEDGELVPGEDGEFTLAGWDDCPR